MPEVIDLKRAAIVLILLSPMAAQTQTLSERAIYERCHAKLVRETPAENDPLVADILAGRTKGAAACKNLISLAKFESDQTVPNYSGDAWRSNSAKKVLSSMNDVHMSWFQVKQLEYMSGCRVSVTRSVVDGLQPSYYFTRALFGNADLTDVVTGKAVPRAVRSENNPDQAIITNRIKKGDPFLGLESVKFIPNGPLQGITVEQNPVVPFLRATVSAPDVKKAIITNPRPMQSLGGGVLGSPGYLLNNFSDQGDLIYDNEVMPRSWSKWVFKDLLCRDLPVIGIAYAEKYVVKAGGPIVPKAGEDVLPFRSQAACVQCHASMDQLGGLARGFRNFQTPATSCLLGDENRTAVLQSLFVQPIVPTEKLTKFWNYVADPKYNAQPGFGRFYFEDYKGKLHDTELNDLEDLGTKIASLDDYYICAAKRYYQYFTGIDVSISPMTSATASTLPKDQQYYRKRVIDLGLKLKGDTFKKNPRLLIEAIFDLPEYKQKSMNMQAVSQ